MFVVTERRDRMPVASEIRVSSHALRRWRERVDSAVSLGEARLALHLFVRRARSRPTPRRWMADAKLTPGLRFLYSDERPGVCVLVLEGTAVTVVTKELCRPAAKRRREARKCQGRRRHQRPARSYERLSIEDALEDAA
jgi:hypothetical protein